MKATAAEAIAYALLDLGVEIVTHVPGYGGSETFQAYNTLSQKRLPHSYHEEPAYTIAHSASMLGKRSAVLIKVHGLTKAANSVTDSLYTEICSGFVTLLFEDKSGRHSDNIMEASPILAGISMPFKIAKTENLYDEVVASFLESEMKKMPVALIINSLDVKNEITFERKPQPVNKTKYVRDVYKHVVHPMLADYQYKIFVAKKLGGNTSIITKTELPQVPDQLPERAKNAVTKYLPLAEIYKNFRGDIVTGDTTAASALAFPPYNLVDIVTYMGGSIPLAIGAYLSGYKNVWAFTGDFGFLSAGSIGLIEAMNREVPIKILVFYNRAAASTGGQPVNKKLLRHMLAGFDNNIVHISDPYNPLEIQSVLAEVSAVNELRIVIADYPQ